MLACRCRTPEHRSMSCTTCHVRRHIHCNMQSLNHCIPIHRCFPTLICAFHNSVACAITMYNPERRRVSFNACAILPRLSFRSTSYLFFMNRLGASRLFFAGSKRGEAAGDNFIGLCDLDGGSLPSGLRSFRGGSSLPLMLGFDIFGGGEMSTSSTSSSCRFLLGLRSPKSSSSSSVWRFLSECELSIESLSDSFCRLFRGITLLERSLSDPR